MQRRNIKRTNNKSNNKGGKNKSKNKGNRNKRGRDDTNGMSNDEEDESGGEGGQFDSILPPELPTAWVQCDKPECLKWRRVPWHIDSEALPDPWCCSLNTWAETPDGATCAAPQDAWDPDRESTLETCGQVDDTFEIGTTRGESKSKSKSKLKLTLRRYAISLYWSCLVSCRVVY